MEGNNLPVLRSLRHQSGFLKSIATLVLVAFVSLCLQPLALAANLPASPKAPTPRATTNDENLAKTLEEVEDRLDKFEHKLSRKEDATKDKDELKRLRQNLDALDQQAIADFDKIGRHLKDKNLPKVILDRHTQAVTTYKTEMATLKANVDDIEQAPRDEDKKLKAGKAKAHLKDKNKQRTRPKFDPHNLPTKAAKPNRENKPRLRDAEFRAEGLFGNPAVQLAAHGDYKFDRLPGASDPAYLAASAEVVFTDSIKAKALELGHDPVKIFNWVYANTEWLLTWGAIQNSDTALQSQKGNAFDLSSLLIALLRASGFPARYVHGTIEIPADKFMNWAGGFTDPNGAWELASAAGIPITAVTGGGRVTAFRLEHVWVEVALDFHPSGGAINKSADSWVQLDPSFKQYIAERGYDMHARLGFDGEQFMLDYLRTGADKTPYQHYSKKVLDHLQVNLPDWTLEGLYGHERVSPLKTPLGGNLRELAASLPYKTLTRGYTAATVPEAFRHKVTVEVANDAISGASANYTIALSDLGAQRLTLSYIPESAADDAVVNDYGTLFAAPAYLVRVKPVLRKAGVTVAVGAGTTLGAKQILTLSFQLPTINVAPVTNPVNAGSYSALVFQGMESARSSPSAVMQQLSKNAELNETNQAQFDDLLGQLLHAIGTQWFFNMVYERNFYSTTTQVAYRWLLTEVMAIADLQVSYWFGIPRSATPGPFIVDADRDVVAAAPIAGDSQRTKHFMLLAGMTGSSWEHLVFEGFFGTSAVSSMKLLRAAADQNIPIHRIDGSNFSQILPLLTLAAEDIADIQNGIAAGKVVTAPQSEVQFGNYRGAGLLILDPDRGDGVYLISGGLAGGYTFKLEEWKRDVYGKFWVSLTARSFVLHWARSKLGTPYGFGCKDQFVSGPQAGRCAEKYGPDSIRIDCSGLIEFAYDMVGFPFFVGKNAQGQYDFVKGNFRIPSGDAVQLGDLIFFENTYEKPWSDDGNFCNEGVSHVGIVFDHRELWLAAEDDMVQFYCSPAFYDANPSRCIKSKVWAYAPETGGRPCSRFFSYGSVLSGP